MATGDLVEGARASWGFDHADAQVHLRVTAVEQPTRVAFDWTPPALDTRPSSSTSWRTTTAQRPGSR
jgi:hypothetical protein